MFVRVGLIVAIVCFGLHAARAATIGVAPGPNGKALEGVKIEGEIEPGDANKFLRYYAYFGAVGSRTVFLRSKGGNVAEAMAIGRLVRRFRLTTAAPILEYEYREEQYKEYPSDDRSNYVCASSCFLIYVAGAQREGEFVILHRPYFRPSDDASVSDVEYERTQKELDDAVRQYLKDMEVEQFYIDKTIGTNSQNAYVPTYHDVDTHPLEGMPPSIEEIMLSECKLLTAGEENELYQLAAANAEKYKRGIDIPAREMELFAKQLSGDECQNRELLDLRSAAWDRFLEQLAEKKCKPGVEAADPYAAINNSILHGTPLPPSPPQTGALEAAGVHAAAGADKDQIDRCRLGVKTDLINDQVRRTHEARPGASPPADFQFDPADVADPQH